MKKYQIYQKEPNFMPKYKRYTWIIIIQVVSFIQYIFAQNLNKKMLGQTYFDDQQITKQQEKKKKNKQNKQNSKKFKKQKHEQQMKSLPASCFSCLTHTDDYLRMIPQPLAIRPTCKSCGFKLSGKLGYLVCPKVVSCFVLCSSCKICSSNHILRKMFSLKHLTQNNLYEKNMFACHGCKEEKQVNQTKGVLHCNVCAFTICHECTQKTESIWQQRNVSSDEEQEQEDDCMPKSIK